MANKYVLTWVIYGCVVIASGLYRHFSRPDGEKGLYFGLVMGALALVAAALLRAGRPRAGHVVGITSVLFVTGWFLYESLIKDGGNHEPRLLIVAVISLIQLAVAIAHLRRRNA